MTRWDAAQNHAGMYRWVTHEGIEQKVQLSAAKNKNIHTSVKLNSNQHIICVSRLKIINGYNATTTFQTLVNSRLDRMMHDWTKA